MSSVVVNLLLLGAPLAVGGVWMLTRRAGRSFLAGPALFAQLVAASAGLAVGATARVSAAAFCAIGLALIGAFLALIDVTRRFDASEPADDDWGGGSDGPQPTPPRDGGGTREPEWWPDFERAFRAHVALRPETVTPRRTAERRATPRRRHGDREA